MLLTGEIIMRKAMVPILAFYLLIPILNAQEATDNSLSRNNGYLTGKAWKEWTEDLKTGYIIGFYDGLRYPSSVANLDTELFHSALNYGEIRAEVDSFFKEGINGPLPIFVALRYISQKAKGAATGELEEYLITVRKVYVDPRK
jgi:hypothetical protein